MSQEITIEHLKAQAKLMAITKLLESLPSSMSAANIHAKLEEEWKFLQNNSPYVPDPAPTNKLMQEVFTEEERITAIERLNRYITIVNDNTTTATQKIIRYNEVRKTTKFRKKRTR